METRIRERFQKKKKKTTEGKAKLSKLDTNPPKFKALVLQKQQMCKNHIATRY